MNKDITKVYFNGGKKKKLRAIDFVGTLTNIPGIDADDIGIITIQENVTYIGILNGKGPFVISEMQNRTVKGKALKVHKAKRNRCSKIERLNAKRPRMSPLIEELVGSFWCACLKISGGIPARQRLY